MKSKIGVVGLWHLGCVISASWAKLGCEVIAIDFDEERVGNLSRGSLPIFEPGLEDLVKEGLDNNLIQFGSDPSLIGLCDYIFIAHDTPVDDNDIPNISSVKADFEKIIPHVRDCALIIISAQLAIGSARDFRENLRSKNKTLDIVYSPENLRLGSAIDCYLNPGHVVLGGDCEMAIKSAEQLFSMIPCSILKMNLPSAEMAKHGINSYLAISIGLSNELSDQCERFGASIKDVVGVMKLDPRIGAHAYLSPGIGYSGGTLGRDLAVLDAKGSEAKRVPWIINAARRGNRERLSYPSQRIRNVIPKIRGATLCLLGMTYKAGTSTLRRSMPIAVARDLANQGAIVNIYDPKADWREMSNINSIKIFDDAYSCAIGADILVLLTDWPEFLGLDFDKLKSSMKGNFIFDTKGQLTAKYGELEVKGFRIISVGRGDLSIEAGGLYE